MHVTDGAQGLGTATVEVTAQQNGGRVYKVMASRDASEANVWDAHFDDSTIPAGSYTFAAYPTDVAHNSGSITTNQAGGTESLSLPFRDMTEITDTLTAGTPQPAATSSRRSATRRPRQRSQQRSGADESRRGQPARAWRHANAPRQPEKAVARRNRAQAALSR